MNILLCCAAGMSTSLLVTKMEEAAKKQGINGRIWAVSANEIDKHIDDANVLLLGPQVRYLLPQMKKIGEEKGIPVAAINPVDYGRMNGENVVQFALGLLHESEGR